MKISLLFLVLIGLWLPLSAQFWQPDFTTAQQVAADSSKNIVLVFSGSDWCAPCIKLERDVWGRWRLPMPSGPTSSFTELTKQSRLEQSSDAEFS